MLMKTANAVYVEPMSATASDQEWQWQVRKRRVVEALLKGSDKFEVLRFGEIGCRDGRSTAYFGEAIGASEVHGFEVDEAPLVDAAQRGVIPHVWIVGETPCPIGYESLHTMLAMDVIEHLADPEPFVLDIAHSLAPNGVFVMTTPNIAWWWSRLQLLFGRQPVGAPGISPRIGFDPRCDPKHLRLGTLNEWLGLLEACGFEIEEVRGYNFPNHLRIPARQLDDCLVKLPKLAHSFAIRARKVGPSLGQSRGASARL
jgi:SAM-dependent methyltransferase